MTPINHRDCLLRFRSSTSRSECACAAKGNPKYFSDPDRNVQNQPEMGYRRWSKSLILTHLILFKDRYAGWSRAALVENKNVPSACTHTHTRLRTGFQLRLWTCPCAVLSIPGFWFHFSSPQCQCQQRCGSLMVARFDDDCSTPHALYPFTLRGWQPHSNVGC